MSLEEAFWKAVSGFVLSLVADLWLYFLHWLSGPDTGLVYPDNIEDVKLLREVAERYAYHHPIYTLIFFSSVFIYNKTFLFDIYFLNLLSGILFGPVKGAILCCTLHVIGSVSCYMFTKHFIKPVVRWLDGGDELLEVERVMSAKRYRYMVGLIFYGLRIFPWMPLGGTDVTAAITGADLGAFCWSVFFGTVAFTSAVTYTGYTSLSWMTSLSFPFGWKALIGFTIQSLFFAQPITLLQTYQNDINLMEQRRFFDRKRG